MPRLYPTISERFWTKVNFTDTCWLWTGALDRDGYGQIKAGGERMPVHRWSYMFTIGAVASGLQLDHLCRVRHCVNPDHLEPVTNRENVLRGVGFPAVNAAKTHCKRGHAFDRIWKGHRICLQCNALHQRNYRARLRAFAKEETA